MFATRSDETTSMMRTLCSAIDSKQIVRFYYQGEFRLVEPFCLGMMSPDKNMVLKCYQVGGYSKFGQPVGWKLFRFSEISNLAVTDDHFTGARPGYDPNDLEMEPIYCQVDLSKVPEEKAPEEKVEEPRKPLSRSYIRMIKLAKKLNQNKKIAGDIYFHPTDKKIVAQLIDLSLATPLSEMSSRPRVKLSEKNRQFWEERWLEAYLINQAKLNDWTLRFPYKENRFVLSHPWLRSPRQKEYKFLLSQLKFRRDSSRGERQDKVLDLLLYDEENQYLVVLALKNKTEASVLDAAKSELDDCLPRLKEAIQSGDIAEAFDLKEITGINAYLVCPQTDSDTEPDLGKYGLIEFDKVEEPWQSYREIGKDFKIGFNNKREPQNLLWIDTGKG
jgi:hypothetical protein